MVVASALLGTGPRPRYAGHGSIPKGTPRYREKTLERMTHAAAAALVNLTTVASTATDLDNANPDAHTPSTESMFMLIRSLVAIWIGLA